MAVTAHLTLVAPDNEKCTVQSAPAKLLRAIVELTRIENEAAKLNSATAAPVAPHDTVERRQATVVFCDLIGSTALWEQRRKLSVLPCRWAIR